jgi:hypothetical protein
MTPIAISSRCCVLHAALTAVCLVIVRFDPSAVLGGFFLTLAWPLWLIVIPITARPNLRLALKPLTFGFIIWLVPALIFTAAFTAMWMRATEVGWRQ